MTVDIVASPQGFQTVTLDSGGGLSGPVRLAAGGKLTGWDVARHAREVNDKLPVIYMTGASAHEWASKGFPNSQLMPKPFAIAQIVIAVAQPIYAAAGSD